MEYVIKMVFFMILTLFNNISIKYEVLGHENRNFHDFHSFHIFQH